MEENVVQKKESEAISEKIRKKKTGFFHYLGKDGRVHLRLVSGQDWVAYLKRRVKNPKKLEAIVKALNKS